MTAQAICLNRCGARHTLLMSNVEAIIAFPKVYRMPFAPSSVLGVFIHYKDIVTLFNPGSGIRAERVDFSVKPSFAVILKNVSVWKLALAADDVNPMMNEEPLSDLSSLLAGDGFDFGKMALLAQKKS